MSAKIAYTFPYSEEGEKEIRHLPVYVDDVDELGIWVHVELGPGDFLSVCAMWSQALEEPLNGAVRAMRSEPQPEETTEAV